METTGYDSARDRLIEVAAAIMRGPEVLERFSTLVDPLVPVPTEIVRLTGITDAELSGAPGAEAAVSRLVAFAGGRPMVAHNAAFDMRFLQLKEDRTGLRFTQPVLDTLLLSAVIHPNQESHKLDVILERLGIKIDSRHNALEDAWATGEVFLKMIPLLEEKGIVTVRQAIEASAKTQFARVTY